MPFQALDLIVNFFVIKERIINREFLKASLSKPFAHKCKLFTFEHLFKDKNTCIPLEWLYNSGKNSSSHPGKV